MASTRERTTNYMPVLSTPPDTMTILLSGVLQIAAPSRLCSLAGHYVILSLHWTSDMIRASSEWSLT